MSSVGTRRRTSSRAARDEQAPNTPELRKGDTDGAVGTTEHGSKGSSDSKLAAKQTTSPRKPAGTTSQWVLIGGFLCIAMYKLFSAYQQFGISFFLGGAGELAYSAEEWTEILEGGNKTIVLMGGPHRGGTTLLWSIVREHPDISHFGDQKQSGIDHSEGMFAQSVFPRFGIGTEYSQMMHKSKEDLQFGRKKGLGGYALADELEVHWTEEHERVTLESKAKLLNQYGALWDLEKPVWIEKSPPNAVLSRFLQAIINLSPSQLEESDAMDEVHKKSIVKFLFITRHPLANAQAHAKLRECKDMHFFHLVENWLRVHEYMMKDLEHLHSSKVIRLEDFAKHPVENTAAAWTWIGLDYTIADLEYAITRTKIIKDPNYLHRKAYCDKLEDAAHRKRLLRLVELYNTRIAKLGLRYDLETFCN